LLSDKIKNFAWAIFKILCPNLSYGTPNFANFVIFQNLARSISPNYKANELKRGSLVDHRPSEPDLHIWGP